jgi:alpha-tubulin suppressor-like RCC1 family protein
MDETIAPDVLRPSKTLVKLRQSGRRLRSGSLGGPVSRGPASRGPVASAPEDIVAAALAFACVRDIARARAASSIFSGTVVQRAAEGQARSLVSEDRWIDPKRFASSLRWLDAVGFSARQARAVAEAGGGCVCVGSSEESAHKNLVIDRRGAVLTLAADAGGPAAAAPGGARIARNRLADIVRSHSARSGRPAASRVPTSVVARLRERIVQVSAGTYHLLLLTRAGRLLSCGEGFAGQLGHGPRIDRLARPRPLSRLADRGVRVLQCSAGAMHSLAVAEGGALFSWGLGRRGRLGHGDAASVDAPTRVEALRGWTVTQASAGGGHSLCVADRGHARGVKGSSPVGSSPVGSSPVGSSPVPGAAADRGALFSWGAGRFGRLGHGDDRSRSRPERVEGFGSLRGAEVLQASAGGYHSLCIARMVAARTGVETPAALFSFGYGADGQLGHGADGSAPTGVPRVGRDALSPRRVVLPRPRGGQPNDPPGTDPPSRASAGEDHSVVLTRSGRVLTFGHGADGQLGHGDRATTFHPREVRALARMRRDGTLAGPVAEIAAGGTSTMALTEDGSVIRWGTELIEPSGEALDDGTALPELGPPGSRRDLAAHLLPRVVGRV